MSVTWVKGVAARAKRWQVLVLLALTALAGITACTGQSGDVAKSSPWDRMPERPLHTDHKFTWLSATGISRISHYSRHNGTPEPDTHHHDDLSV